MPTIEQMGFEKPTQTVRHPKVMIFGDAGTGKTWFALAAGTPEAEAVVIDTEGGSHFYGKHTGHHFIRKDTQSIRDAHAVVTTLANMDDHAPLIIDSGTMMWELQQEAVAEKARVEDLQFHHWNKVKKPFKRFYTKVMALPRPVIITAHEAAIYDEVMENGRKQLKVTGYKPKFEGGASYVFDLVIRLGVVGGQRKAIVEKSRLPGFDKGKIIDDPTYHGIIAAAYGDAKMGVTTVVDHDAAVEDAKAGMTHSGDQLPDDYCAKDETLRLIKIETDAARVEGLGKSMWKQAVNEGWDDELKAAVLKARERCSPGRGPAQSDPPESEAVATPAEAPEVAPAPAQTPEVDDDGVPLDKDVLMDWLKEKVDEAQVSAHIVNIQKKYSDICVKRGGVELSNWFDAYCKMAADQKNDEYHAANEPPHPADDPVKEKLMDSEPHADGWGKG